MSKRAAAPGMAQLHVERRRARILDRIRRPLRPCGAGAKPLSAERLEFLRKEAEELYWNELTWEELTDEEAVSGGHLTEMAFPGFLAFVDGLLIEVPTYALLPARPHPDVVEEILLSLSEKYTRFTTELEGGADSERLVWARVMTARLIDLVLYRLYRLTPEECEELDAVG